LIYASSRGHVEIVKLLIVAGANLNEKETIVSGFLLSMACKSFAFINQRFTIRYIV
jgi:ankyrin repeat protein